MTIQLSHRRHRPGPGRPGQPAPPALPAAAQPDRAPRAAERPRAAVVAGHGAGICRIGRNTVIAACDQLALEGYLAMRPRTPPLVMDLPTRDGRGRASIDAGRQSDLGARADHAVAALSPRQAGHAGVPSGHAGPRQFPVQHLVETAQPAGKARASRPVRHLSRQRLPAAVRGDRALPHGVARREMRRRADRRHQRRPIGVRPAGAHPHRRRRHGVDGGAGILRRRLGLRFGGRETEPAGGHRCRLEPRAAARHSPADLRHAVLPPSARHDHADGAAAQSHPPGGGLERLDRRGRFRRRVPVPGPAHPGPARHQRVKPRGLCRHLRQGPVSGDAPRLPGGARSPSATPSSRRSASPASSRRC